ncbi:MAG TPA: hypothetical protein P5338_03190 [Bacteroidales bacterium]|nr:hypothetical protein [Bacteroidales bacterium]
MRFSAGEFTFDASFSINYIKPITIEGASTGITTLKAGSSLGSNPLISAVTQTHIRNLKIQSYNVGIGEAIRMTGSSSVQYIIENVSITGFNTGIQQTDNSVFTLSSSEINSCTSSGVHIDYSSAATIGARIKINNTNFSSNLNAVNLYSGNKAEVYITRNHFLPGTGNTAITRNASSFLTPDDMFINGNTWNNTGTFLSSGIDLTRSDGRDAKFQIRDNAGYNKLNGYVNYVVAMNTSNTPGFANVWRIAVFGIGTTSYSSKLFSVAGNKFTYLPEYSSDCIFTIRGDIFYGQNEDIDVAFVKNGQTGTTYGETTIRRFNNYIPFAATGIVPDLQKDDYLEFYIKVGTNNNVQVRNLNILLETR